MDGRMDGRTDAQTDRRTDGRMDGQTHAWKDGWMQTAAKGSGCSGKVWAQHPEAYGCWSNWPDDFDDKR